MSEETLSPQINVDPSRPKQNSLIGNLKLINWKLSTPYILMHVALIPIFFMPFHWKYVGYCLGLHAIRAFGITAAYHRYFAHRTYKMGRAMQFAMACLGCLGVQKGPLWWASTHRHHHRFSDLPEDLHSPKTQGFFWSHLGWFLSNQVCEPLWKLIPDLAKFPELRWLDRFHYVPVVLLAVATLVLGGVPGLVWGFVASTVLLWHVTNAINSVAHVWGTRRYETTDTSRNNFLLAILAMGEGWHNNHHCYQSSSSNGFFWWEIDLTYYGLKVMSWMGLVKDLRKPPLALLEAKRVGRAKTSSPVSIPISVSEPMSSAMSSLADSVSQLADS